MNYFTRLVQNKRTKMLTFVLLLTISVLIQHSTGINLTYIIKKEKDHLQPSCVAEENERYSAIGWIYPLPDNEDYLPNITNKFIPTIENAYNCKFSKTDKCNKIWAIKNWDVDENSSRIFDLIFDRRWEDFPAIFTNRATKEFAEKIEISNTFKIGFSLRATESVELLICEGWNPYSYPCYYLNLTKTSISLRKYMTLPKNISLTDKILDLYQAFSNIVSDDEWRNFIVSFDDRGVLSLIDVSVNRTVIEYQDKQPLKPLYLLVRSIHPALWKIHQNHFIYTKTNQISRLGPVLNLASKDVCVSLFVSTCGNCAMNFFILKGHDKKILKEVPPSKNFEWKLIKLKEENILEDKINIFVETKYVDPNLNQTEGFWAVDDVRVCHENEVKVTFLKLQDGNSVLENSADGISCQVIQNPNWRPKKLVYSKIEDFPSIENSSNSTSIDLTWTQEDPNSQINYFITYKANDICLSEPFNLRRTQSSGFLMTKHNEIKIENLVPYTKYNITFSSMLHEKEKTLFVTTLETTLPTPEELPNKIQVQVADTKAYVSWDKIDCSSTYGHTIYSMKITNGVLNTTKNVSIQTENTVEINDLEPFTLYSLEITTARNFENIENDTNAIKMNVNFTTQAGLAPSVRNLEIYSVDEKSVSFRYDLPKKPRGVPVAVQVTRCNPILFKKCKSTISAITPCKLWPRKYCVDASNLISHQRHTFKVSIKNDFTHAFGDEVVLDTLTDEQIPGPPANITYKIVDCLEVLDYCHLNITWLHPYNQNGTITSFHIVLNATDNTTTENIQEILKITNKTYLPQYEYQIKYIPYSTHYELFVQSANTKYKSSYEHTHVKTADIGDHIDQKPKLLGKNSNSVIFKIPPVDRRLRKYDLTIVVQDFNRNKSVPEDALKMNKVSDHLCHNFGNTWVLETIEITNSTENLTIGTSDNVNKYLEAETQYCITFIVTNSYRNSEHDVVYYEKFQTPSAPTTAAGTTQYTHLYGLLFLLLLIPLGYLAYRYIKRRKPRPKKEETRENVYESLPFEECEENCVSNDTYDQLLHK